MRWLRWLLGSAVLLLAGWALVWEPSRLTVARTTVALPGWPQALNGLRVVQLSDLHIGAPWIGLDKLRTVVARSNAERPDLVLLTGDYVQGVLGGRDVPPAAIAAELAGLKARLGVYAVMGNHDWWLDGPAIQAAFAAAGLTVLEDQTHTLSDHGMPFHLLGIGDFNETRHDWRGPLAALPPGEPVLAFTHNPDVFAELSPAITLTFAGHTHGGQVRLPWLGVRYVPSHYGNRYARGLVRENGRSLFVSSGIGTSKLPIRFGVPPEISVVELQAATVAPSSTEQAPVPTALP